MIKKLLHTAFSLVYFLLSVGIGYSQHFCGGELKSTSIIAQDLSCCCDRGDSSLKADCCYETSVFYQISDEQLSTSNISVPSWGHSEFTTQHFHYNFEFLIGEDKQSLHQPNAPPKNLSEDLYKTYCSFIFYG